MGWGEYIKDLYGKVTDELNSRQLVTKLDRVDFSIEPMPVEFETSLSLLRMGTVSWILRYNENAFSSKAVYDYQTRNGRKKKMRIVLQAGRSTLIKGILGSIDMDLEEREFDPVTVHYPMRDAAKNIVDKVQELRGPIVTKIA